MGNYRHVLGGLLLCATSLSSPAADYKLSAEYESCINGSGGATHLMDACTATELKLQDARLNKEYKALMAALPSARQKQLRAAQRLWIKYREANCNFYYDPGGGQAARILAHDCLLMETATRAQEIAHVYR